MPRKLTIEEMRLLALDKNGKCLSNEYINSETKLSWQCSKGHIWEASPHNIKNGTWCPKCNLKSKRTIDEINAIAKNKGGVCLSKNITSVYSKIKLQCGKEHIWETSVHSILYGKNWCPYCSRKVKKTINELREFAISKGGLCLSDNYLNSHSKIKWQCEKGHIWEATPALVMNHYTWCPVCAGSMKSTIEEMQKIAESRGGKVISIRYKDGASHLKWQCSEGHIWKATPNNIKNGTWCPKCYTNISENICNSYFNIIFDKKFLKKRPKWLISLEGHKMELDGYNEELKIAFEYQGEQHYNFMNAWHKNEEGFEKLKLRDIQKEILCKQNNITLIKIPYTVEKNKIYSFIINELIKNNITIPKHKKNRYKDLDIYSNRMIEEMRKIATERGGNCLSVSYVDSYTKLKWQCRYGHIWEAHPHSVKNSNSWCPHCSGRARHSLESMQNIAEARGGKCLSAVYENSNTKLKWQCSKGHIWEATPSHIKNSNSWCPKCAHINKRVTINEMKKIAESRGGKCLSENLVSINNKLQWQCKNGHIWVATPIQINVKKSWCPICANINKRLTITEMRAIAESRGGKCLSEVYVDSTTKLKWKCVNGHIWEARPIHIKNMNSWCPTCANIERSKYRRSNIEAMQKIALSRGGECLSEVYVNARTKIKWQCRKGHTWEAIPKQISRGTWCPICSRKKKNN